MKYLIYLAILLTKVQPAFSYIPNLDFILKKNVATTGRQIVSIEQDVIFNIGSETATVKETWLIEGDKNLKLVARGQGELNQNINLHYLYNGKNRISVTGKNKNASSLTHDFFQRLLFIRSANTFKNYIHELGINEGTRLSRTDGRIAFAIGEPSTEVLKPQIWIDQEDFAIRKIRLPSEADISLSDISQVSKDLWVAKSQKISWANFTVQVKVKKISAKTTATLNQFYPQNLDQPSEFSFSNRNDMNDIIDQFYKRFR
jgi:hypothetical protein